MKIIKRKGLFPKNWALGIAKIDEVTLIDFIWIGFAFGDTRTAIYRHAENVMLNGVK